MTHSGCGYEPGSRGKGGKEKEGERERIEGKKERNSAGKVFSHGARGERKGGS